MSGYTRYPAGKRYRSSLYGRPSYSRRWGSTYGKAVGSTRAAKTGNKISYYNAQVTGYATMNWDTGAFLSRAPICFTPFYGGITMTGSGAGATYANNDSLGSNHGAAVLDKGFRLMCALNDECRLCKISVKLQSASVLPNNVAVKLFSVVDRNYTKAEFDRYTGADDGDEMVDTFTTRDITENPSAVIQSFNGNRITPLSRYSVPTDLKEKTGWMDCSIVYNKTTGESPLKLLMLKGWKENNSSYAPMFAYAAQTSLAAAASTTITFSYTVEYSFAFRNPKSNIDKFIATEQWGLTNPNSAKTTKTEQADPKTKKNWKN